MEIQDYYDFLQISPSAEPDTIHRVYRFLAARLHPDNQDTGDAEKFFLLKQAYDVLSNPECRAAYDATRKTMVSQPVPLSTWIDFMDNMEGELNRRLAVLAVLYFQRRANPYAPKVSFVDIERRLGFPRDYLEFTAWYLRSKGYITRADNADLTLTAEGVDFVETQLVNIPVLDKLLTTAEGSSTTGGAAANKPESPSPTHVIVPPRPRVTDGNYASEGIGNKQGE
jgi:curved DNA-binding protein CbpA